MVPIYTNEKLSFIELLGTIGIKHFLVICLLDFWASI